jgi:hypothetical protein
MECGNQRDELVQIARNCTNLQIGPFADFSLGGQIRGGHPEGCLPKRQDAFWAIV